MSFPLPGPDGQSNANYFSSQDTSPFGHRRAYSSFANDPSATTQPITANMFAPEDLLYGFDDGLDQSDPKRRRIARACDMCRKKKIKCDGKMPACTHCQNYKTECVFTHVEKKRNPPKGAKYIEGLENRLGRMEALLRLSGLLSEEDADSTDLQTLERRLAEKNAQLAKDKDRDSQVAADTSSNVTTPVATPSVENNSTEEISQNGQKSTNVKSRKGETEVEALSEAMCSLVTDTYGDTRYIGSSSGFSIFSPKGIQWVNEKTGDSSFQDMITNNHIEDNKWVQWKPDVFEDIFKRRVYQPLPPKPEALSLLNDYFTHFNCMFPLFHEPTFMHLVEKHYSHDPYEGSGWWASLNVALAIAHRLRVMSNLVSMEEDQKAWGYLKNALAVQSELTIRNTDLLSVQALLGMSLFLMGTPNPQPSFFLVAAAIRLAHSLGLHKRGTNFGLNSSEVEQRKRVFWIAYMLDKDICLRSGRPPIQDDDDMNVELPNEDPPDNIGNIPLADGKGKVNLFRLMCQFAVIASKVYKQLYSVKATKQADGELLNTIGELDNELEEWKDSIPIDFRPEHEINASHTPLILHVVVLHFAYYNCLTTIHRMSVHHGYWTSRLSNYAIQGLNVRPLNPRVFSSAALCVSAARASIHLIKYIPQNDFACVWMILYYPVSALVTLFANILQNPQDTRARSDLKLMNHVIQFLTALCTDESNGAVRRMLSICSEFERISKIVLDKSDGDSSSRRKRKPQDENKQTSPPIQTPRMQSASQASVQPGNIPIVFSLAKDAFQGGSNPTGTPGPPVGSGQYLSTSNTPLATSPMSRQTSPNASNFNFSVPSTTGIPSNLNGTSIASNSPSPASIDQSNLNPQSTDLSEVSNGYTQSALPFSLIGNAFQQPFVPQDLWQMPMTLEWDWAEMSNGYGENSLQVNGVLNDIPTPAAASLSPQPQTGNGPI